MSEENKYIPEYNFAVKNGFVVKHSELSKDELIEYLKFECRRVKIQRNQYEEKLTLANRKINKLESEVKGYVNYINLNTT